MVCDGRLGGGLIELANLLVPWLGHRVRVLVGIILTRPLDLINDETGCQIRESWQSQVAGFLKQETKG